MNTYRILTIVYAITGVISLICCVLAIVLLYKSHKEDELYRENKKKKGGA